MILVTGATGNVGRHLVAGLLSEGCEVRALTRDPSTASLPAGTGLAAAGPENLAAAVAGVSAVFVNVRAVGGYAGELLAQARQAGVSRVVMLSSFAIRESGNQQYSIGAQHKVVEDAVRASGMAWTFLRCGGFAVNSLSWAPMIRADGVVRVPYPEAATAPVAEQDVAAAAVTVLLGTGHEAATYVLTGGESLTQAGQVSAIGAAIGRELRVEELPADAFRQMAGARMPAPVVEDMLSYLAAHVGRTAEMSADLEKLTGRPPMAFGAWAVTHADEFR